MKSGYLIPLEAVRKGDEPEIDLICLNGCGLDLRDVEGSASRAKLILLKVLEEEKLSIVQCKFCLNRFLLVQ